MPASDTITLVRRARLTAGIAAVFVLVVAGILLALHFTATTSDPWKSPQLLALKEQLAASPKDEAVKTRIRELDFQFRQSYRRRLRLGETGGWLLLAGAVVFIVAFQTATAATKIPPSPSIDPEAAAKAARRAARSRRAVLIAGGACGLSMLAVSWGVRSHFSTLAAATPATPALPPLPPAAEFARQWPRFRGPDGGGAVPDREAPVRWDAATGAGIVWRTEIPAPGHNSPVIWGDRVFLSGATRDKREVFCLDAASGRILWSREIEASKTPGPKPPDLSEETGYAAPTLATDGRHVYAIFGNGTLTAVTFDGRVAWSKHLGAPRNPYGHATSLAVWEGRVFLQYDQGESEAAGSKLLAFDGASGRLLWEKSRSSPSTWATPIVIEAAGRAQIVTLGLPHVVSYAPADGAELWRFEGLEGEITPSPIFAGGLVQIINPNQKLLALRPDGTGDVTSSHVAWQVEDSMPDITSPVSDGTRTFIVNTGGELMCFDTKTGALAWKKDLESAVHASPAIIGRHLYVPCANGTTVVAGIGAEYQEVARNPLGEKLQASPAFAGGRLYLRGERHLFCLGTGAPPSTPSP